VKSQLSDSERIRLERRVLHVLCQGTDEGSIRSFARGILEHYRWREPIHQALFSALMALPLESLDAIRFHLPARLARMGYPDVDWEAYFKPERFSKAEAEELVQRLRQSG
jgi:hypothetical protein